MHFVSKQFIDALKYIMMQASVGYENKPCFIIDFYLSKKPKAYLISQTWEAQKITYLSLIVNIYRKVHYSHPSHLGLMQNREVASVAKLAANIVASVRTKTEPHIYLSLPPRFI
uniref:Uncharacterized protein n=1 Tax=Sphaerodactylus townsendi TaxID=933632 RepID=A0ACB8FDW9_9SAUR